MEIIPYLNEVHVIDDSSVYSNFEKVHICSCHFTCHLHLTLRMSKMGQIFQTNLSYPICGHRTAEWLAPFDMEIKI